MESKIDRVIDELRKKRKSNEEVVAEEHSSQGHDKESYRKECQLDKLNNTEIITSLKSMKTLAETEKDMDESRIQDMPEDNTDGGVPQNYKPNDSHGKKFVGLHNSELQEIEAVEDESSDEQDTEAEITNTRSEDYLFPTPDELNKSCPPVVGQVFATLEEAVRFVNVYGQTCGFSVIKGRNYKGRKISLICNKGRKTVSSATRARKRRRRTIDRIGCPMNVTIKIIEGSWCVLSLHMEHNHGMSSTPSLIKFFLSHQHMNEEEIMLSQLLQEVRVKPRGIMTIFRKLCGSFGNIMFSTKKLDNLKQGEIKQKKNSDIEYTIKYIEKIQLLKPGFCHRMEVDSDGSVRSIFWTDARSRLDYKLYGEIISFDTTYSTNRYNMPFAPIIGVNGHGRTIVFGWALLKDQTAETFLWLFREFVDVMEGKKPTLILTDQDQAMRNAISIMFPSAWHRWCIWHVLGKMREHLFALMATMEGMEEEIIRVIMESLYVDEFEAGWKQMEITYDCAKHDHIIRMWKNRAMFVPAYFRDQFCPFTRSTSRSESFNSNFKDYIRRKDTIEIFLKQYELFQENVVEIENRDRFESTQQIPAFWGHQLIEKHARKIYTRGIYLKFLTELPNSTAFAFIEVEKDKEYKTKKLFRYKNLEFWREEFTIRVDHCIMKLECECNKFERDGILCCHILRLFTQFDVTRIPDHYILPRSEGAEEEEPAAHGAAPTSTSNTMVLSEEHRTTAETSPPPQQDIEASTPMPSPQAPLPKKARVGAGSTQEIVTGNASTPLLDDPLMKELINLGSQFIGSRDEAATLRAALRRAEERADALEAKLKSSETARKKTEEDAAAVEDLRQKLTTAENALSEKEARQIERENAIVERFDTQNRRFTRRMGEEYTLHEETEDRLLDTLSILELNGDLARTNISAARGALKRFFPHFFPKETQPEIFSELVQRFMAKEDPALAHRQNSLKIEVEGTIALVAASSQEIDWLKASTPQGLNKEKWKALVRDAKPHSKKIIAYLDPKSATYTSTARTEVK
ncbi:hypothetical protein ACQ4PT_028284 [Festuca glaucescens]